MWNVFQVLSVAALAVSILLGVVVFLVNPQRRANRYFLIASLALASWLECLAIGSFTRDRATLVTLMRVAGFASVLILPAFDILRHALVHEREDRRAFGRECAVWVVLLACAAAITLSPWYVRGVDFGTSGFPRPIHGQGRVAYTAVFAAALVLLIARYRRALRTAGGTSRLELEFGVLASAAACALGLFFGQIAPALTGNRDLIQYMPLCAILYDVLLAYGMVTRRIMNVSDVLRRAAAYALLGAYLVLLYVGVYVPGAFLLATALTYGDLLAHLLAAAIVAFSLAPAQGFLQRVANRLFINIGAMDVPSTLQKAHAALSSIGTIQDLLARFGELTAHALGTDRVLIALRDDGAYRQVYPAADGVPPVVLQDDGGLPRMLAERREPVALDVMRRVRPTPMRRDAARALSDRRASLAVGIHSKGRMEGVVLLGARLSGRVFSVEEQGALQILCDQLGVALENARLYTALQDGKIYNEILLDSLVSGVVAVDAGLQVTVFNQKAQAITGLRADDVIGRPADGLPAPLPRILRATLDRTENVRDQDMTLASAGREAVPVRISGAAFRGHTGQTLGALLVVHDMTQLRKLEEHIRRSDRLSSLGTLSAGMAHEIKNPLVSIKTFTQLLPTQYGDEEFRRTFSDLVVREVQRIDTLVTRLLHFARPARAALEPTHLHDVVGDTLRLLDQQLRKHGIELVRELNAERDLIMGDAGLLSQAFLNFLLNAIEAMAGGGRLTVSSACTASGGEPGGDGATVRILIRDTGCGIPAADLPRIFDPFFTTKTSGTGLGLSVAHGIVQEHAGRIDVESRQPGGTCFQAIFPLVKEDA